MSEPKEVITDEKRVLVVIFHAPVPIKYENGKVVEVRQVQPTEYTVGDLPADIRDTLLEAEANAKKADVATELADAIRLFSNTAQVGLDWRIKEALEKLDKLTEAKP